MADLTQTAANVGLTDAAIVPNQLGTGEAGEAITQGMPIYEDGAGEMVQADASAASTSKCDGIALTPAADGETVIWAKNGVTVDLGATLTVSETYVVSDTKGAIMPIGDLTTGEVPCILGTATTAGKLLLNIVEVGVAKP